MTEQEAKSKWCPFANVADRGNRPQIVRDARKFRRQRSLAFEVQTRCLGSGCMAWRWADRNEVVALSEYDEKKLRERGYREIGHRGNALVFVRESRGYCGLAGAST